MKKAQSLFFATIFILFLITGCMMSDMDDAGIVFKLSSSTNDARPTDTILPNGLKLTKKDGVYYWQGDMMYFDSTLYRLLPPDRSGIRDDAQYYWPYRIVNYYFPPNCPPNFVNAVTAAMSSISAVSSISFVNSTNDNYIRFVPGLANASAVGMQGGEQAIYINSITHQGTIIHELMHALGFIHEMCRPDRDSYITMNWDNIRDEIEAHYGTVFSYPTTIVGPFDFNSVMMYNSIIPDATIVYDTGEPMFTKLDGSEVYAIRDTLSAGDINGLKAIYGPPFHRLERYLRVIDEYCYGVDDYVEMEITDKVVFYSDEACTQRQALTFPRQLYLRQTTQECHGYGSPVQEFDYYYTINVPAGADSVLINHHFDVEHYLYSDPYEIQLISYHLINAHVNPLFQPMN